MSDQTSSLTALETPATLTDPYSGLYSERLKSNISRDAFRSASSTAQDSELYKLTAKLLPESMRKNINLDIQYDLSPTARHARIAALQGEIPRWAKGDPENDPSLIKIREVASKQPPSRDTSKSPQPSPATVAVKLTQKSASLAAKQPTSAPVRSPSKSPASSDRER